MVPCLGVVEDVYLGVGGCLWVCVGWCLWVYLCVGVLTAHRGKARKVPSFRMQGIFPTLQMPFSPQTPSWSSLVGPQNRGRWGSPSCWAPPLFSGPPVSPTPPAWLLSSSPFVFFCSFVSSSSFLTCSFPSPQQRRWVCGLKAWTLVPTLPFTSCVVCGRFFTLSNLKSR